MEIPQRVWIFLGVVVAIGGLLIYGSIMNNRRIKREREESKTHH
jgi:hypothetical protein